MAGEINFGLLNTNAPMQAADAFSQGVADRRKSRLEELAAQQAEQQMADDGAYRDAYKQSGGDQNALLRQLQSAGLYKQAQEVQKQQLAQQVQQATLGKTQVDTKAAQFKLTTDQHDKAIKDVSSFQTPQDAIASLDMHVQNGELAPEVAARMKSAIPTDPAQFSAWKQKTLTGLMGAKEQLEFSNPKPVQVSLGNRVAFVDTNPNSPTYKKEVSSSAVGMNPGTAAQLAQSERHFQINQAKDAAPSPEAGLGQDDLKTLAEQYRAGDTSVFTNLGRGRQGAANIIALRKEIGKQTREAGLTGADIAATNAEYFGTKAGQRTVGTRTANVELATNEATQLLPLAREASAEVARSGLLPFGKAQIMFDNQTNDPKLRQFAAANNSLINVYARAISPSGVPTVADKEHAREMLSTAMDNKSYNAVLDQMQRELNTPD